MTGKIIKMTGGLDKAGAYVDRLIEFGRLSPALKQGYIDAGVHESRVEDYLRAAKAARCAGKSSPAFADFSQPTNIADVISIDYSKPYQRRP